MLVLGIMSGTSIDGVDYALCEVSDRSIRLVRLWSKPFPRSLRARLHAAAAGQCSSHELGQLHHDLGRLYACQAAALTSGAELVGLHGQTVYHQPSRKSPATLQIGEPSYLSEALRVPVVSNFRAADIAAGGQGAPLATLFHQVVFGQRGKHVCVNNLGGISNVTSIDWRNGGEPRLLAFDTGPANVLIDLAMRSLSAGRLSFDRDGAWAKRGRADDALVERWLRQPYFRAKPPKSTGRELFGEPFWQCILPEMRRRKLSNVDIIATLAEFTARSVALSYRLHLPSAPYLVILCGGGAENPELFRRIARALHSLGVNDVRKSGDFGWPVQAIEASAFALLAYRRLRRKPGAIPSTTGAARAAVLGQIAEP